MAKKCVCEKCGKPLVKKEAQAAFFMTGMYKIYSLYEKGVLPETDEEAAGLKRAIVCLECRNEWHKVSPSHIDYENGFNAISSKYEEMMKQRNQELLDYHNQYIDMVCKLYREWVVS